MWQLLLTFVIALYRLPPMFFRRAFRVAARILVATDSSVPVIPERATIELLAAGWCPRRFMGADSNQSDSDHVITDAWNLKFMFLPIDFPLNTRLSVRLFHVLSRERLLPSAVA
jgi:hypothetical protein